MNSLHFRFRRGLDLPLAGAPAATVDSGQPVDSVALLGPDYEGLKPSMCVAEGDIVRLGDPLFSDRRTPTLRFTSPGSGRVRQIVRGARRRLHAIIIDLEGDEAVSFDEIDEAALPELEASQVRERLLTSGLWTAIRMRPFARIPDPDGPPPSALFVTVMDSNPLAGSVDAVLEGQVTDLHHGVSVLSRLTEGPVYVCAHPRTPIPDLSADNVMVARFQGPHPSGLAGTHIHTLHPAGPERPVWHVHYQDAMAIGRLFTTGRICTERVIALSGPMMRRPRLVRTRLGASLPQLLRGELEDGACRVVSGSVFAGHHATGWASYLGRYERQVTALREGEPRRFFGWLMPGADRYSAVPAYLGSLRPGHRFSLSTALHGGARAMVPIGNFESVMPLDVLPAPLLKALIVGDTDTARQLGCLELDQEDLALCSFVCPSKYDYGAYLRRSLDQIEREG